MASIRRAVASDLEQIVALLEEFPEDPQLPNVNWQDARKAFPELLEEKKGLMLVAEQNGVVAGMVTLAYSYVLRFGGEYALIEDFIVGEKFRGKGIGGPLLKVALDEAKRRGCREVQVNGASDIGFPVYVRNGFHEAGTHLKYWL